MRRPLYLSFMIILGFSLFGCSEPIDSNLPIRAYVYIESDEIIKPSLTLKEDKEFIFIYSQLSSYLGLGHYDINNEMLTLKTDDGKNEYVFELEDGTLIFNAEKSSNIPSYANVPNGAVFK